MFDQYNTDGYSDTEIAALNNELATRLNGIDDPDEIDNIEKRFAEEVARR